MHSVTCTPEFWDILATQHAVVENNYFDLPSLRRILVAIHPPVLVVGAGQGLIVAELQSKGFRCDGVDLSPEMIRYAKLRRGLVLVQANARAMPFEARSYETIIYATGVVDFIGDEEEIRIILAEGKRIVTPSGKIFVAFYRLSDPSEEFLKRVGLLRNHFLFHKQTLEMYLLNPVQMVAWVAKKTGVGFFRALIQMLRLSAFTTFQEKAMTFRMQRMFRDTSFAKTLINAAPEKQAYRNEAEIRNLFQRLAIPIAQLQTLGTCFVVEI